MELQRVRSDVLSQKRLHRLHSCLPDSSEVWGERRDEVPFDLILSTEVREFLLGLVD